MISDSYKEFKIKINGLETRVFAYGDPKNTPILFIHGYFRSYSTYIGDLPIRYLKDKYYVIAFDLPGFGWSKAFKNLSSVEFVKEIQDQILAKKEAIVFGVSYGGLVAIEFAWKYPKRVKSLIIAGTPVFYGAFRLFEAVRILPKYQEKKITKEIFEEFKFLTPNNLKTLKTPTLLYYSKYDFAANTLMGRKLQSMIPNSKLIVSNKGSHRWLLHRIDQNGLLVEIQKFLA